MPGKRPLRRGEATTYLEEKHGIRRAPSTLAKYAVVGGGPRFRLAGRTPLYEPEDLDTYAESLLSPAVHSTSELVEWRKRRAERTGQLTPPKSHRPGERETSDPST